MALSVVTLSGWREEESDLSAVTAGGWRQESVPDLGGGGVGDEGITVTSFAARRVWEGASGSGLVTITGTHTGIMDTIEVQIEDTSAAVVVAWTALQASVAEGVYSGQVSVPRGGWYRARVRKASDAGISALQTTDWGVGYIIGGFGQSQLVNFSGSGSGTPNDRAVTFDGSTWSPLTADGAGRNAFSNALIGVADCPVAMIFSAASGVEISRWWAAGKTSHYTAWESIVSAAGGDLSAFLLWQGEGDANIYRSKAAYKADIDAIFAQLRSDISATLPVVIVNLGRLTGTGLDDNAYEQIRDAHVEAAASPNNQGVVTYDLPLSDSAHINATGQIVVGNRLAQCMAHAYALASYSQGPRVASVATTSSTVVDVVIEHDGGTDFTPTTGITGFSVLDGGAPVSISTVERLSASAVRITLAAPLVGAVSVRYGYGRNPDISGVLKDNSSLSLPMVTTDADVGFVTPTITAITASNITQTGATITVSRSNPAAGTLYLVIVPSGVTPTWSRANIATNSGWTATTIAYHDADTDPGSGATYVFTPDASGLTASTPYDLWVVWDDGTTTVGPVQGTGFTTASAAVTLTIQDAAHAHTAEAATLSSAHALTIAGAAHSHAADAIALAAGLSLSTDSASHAHSAEHVTLSAALALAVQDAAHTHAADTATLSAALNLVVQDTLHAHAADNLALVASDSANLTIADAAHSHFAEALALSAAHSLVVQDSAHGHTAQALSLSAALNLLVDAAIHAHTAESATLNTSAASNLTIASSSHAHLADALTLSGALSLVVDGSSHAHSATNPTLSAAHSLVVQNAAHAHVADALALNTGFALSIANAFHAHVAEGLSLDTALALAIDDALHTHQAEAVTLTAALTLIVADTLHEHLASNVGIYIPTPTADLLRRSVFLRIAQQRPFVRVDEQRVFIRVQ